jgi:uncharacterized protein with ParB-like and HNH nuclease domain
MEISSDRRSVHQCLEQRFALPTYQREYKWELKHFQDLLQDILESFFAQYAPEHGRPAVANYDRYFLGTIITTPAPDGFRTIVDGQQRLTTLALVIAYFVRLAKKEPELQISEIGSLLRRRVFGQNEFNITFDPARKQLFELLLDYEGDPTGDSLESKVDSIPNIDNGSRRLYQLFTHTSSLLGKLQSNQIPFFVDYLTQCVILFEITVPGEQDGHKVFVTMNDRGLKLSPIDLLKGYMLSSIQDDAQNVEAHKVWKANLHKLRELGSDEDSTFLKTWLRAQYGESIRGKQKGAAPRDFEVIGDSYHRWVVDNRAKLGLKNSDDFFKFLTTILPLYVDLYVKVKSAETGLNTEYPSVFYYGARDLTLQSMLVLAAVAPTDTPAEVKEKIRVIGHFLDCFATNRLIKRQDNTYNNLRDPLFELTKQIRRKPLPELRALLYSRLVEAVGSDTFDISDMYYHMHDTSDILHGLARIAEFMETEFQDTTKVGFAGYVQRARGNTTYDIEHVLSTNVASIKADLSSDYDFPSDTDFARERNRLGALILLSRGRNRSLKDEPYSKKIEVYATESVLSQSLTENFYKNNPQVTKTIGELGLEMSSVAKFNAKAIAERAELYNSIGHMIWNAQSLLA